MRYHRRNLFFNPDKPLKRNQWSRIKYPFSKNLLRNGIQNKQTSRDDKRNMTRLYNPVLSYVQCQFYENVPLPKYSSLKIANLIIIFCHSTHVCIKLDVKKSYICFSETKYDPKDLV